MVLMDYFHHFLRTIPGVLDMVGQISGMGFVSLIDRVGLVGLMHLVILFCLVGLVWSTKFG